MTVLLGTPQRELVPAPELPRPLPINIRAGVIRAGSWFSYSSNVLDRNIRWKSIIIYYPNFVHIISCRKNHSYVFIMTISAYPCSCCSVSKTFFSNLSKFEYSPRRDNFHKLIITTHPSCHMQNVNLNTTFRYCEKTLLLNKLLLYF